MKHFLPIMVMQLCKFIWIALTCVFLW